MARVADPAKAPAPATRQPSGLRAVSFRINPAHVRLLLWLRLRLTFRRFRRSWQAVVGLIIGLLFIFPISGGLGFLTALGYTQLDRPAAAQLLFAVVALLYLIWAALPLLQYSLNEGLDVTKLQIYPLTRGEQMVSLVLATLLDLSTLFLVALYVAVLVGWHATPAATVVTVVALAAAYVHTVGLSQLVLAALMGLLRSRRFRDLTVIVFALFGSVCSVSSQIISRVFVPRGGGGSAPDLNAALASLHLDTYLKWTPPGMAAQSIVTADQGDYFAALPWLAGSLVLVPVLLYIWAVVLDRGITNAESGTTSARRGRRRASVAVLGSSATGTPVAAGALPTATAAPRRRLISPVSLAITGKDFRYLWRDPQLKAQLISVLFATIFILVPGLYGGGHSTRAVGLDAHLSVLLAPLPALFVVLTFGLNALGLDRQGLQMLFLFPVRPLDILWGKNLFTGALAFVLAIALTAIKAAITGGWEYAPLALAAGIAGIFVMLACGNVTSVIAPFRMRQFRMGETGTYSSENGCLRAVISTVSLVVTSVLLIPVAAAVLAPVILDHWEWLAATLPAAILYGAALHQLASRLIAPVLLRRAPEILAVTVREA